MYLPAAGFRVVDANSRLEGRFVGLLFLASHGHVLLQSRL